MVPVVTVEWGESSGSSLLAYYRNGAYDCPAGRIEVRTYDFVRHPYSVRYSSLYYRCALSAPGVEVYRFGGGWVIGLPRLFVPQ